MPGPQTQHKGTVYGDDENAPKPGLFFFFYEGGRTTGWLVCFYPSVHIASRCITSEKRKKK